MSARWSTTVTPSGTTPVEDETEINSRYIDSLLLRTTKLESLVDTNTGSVSTLDSEIDALDILVAANTADILTIEGQLSAVSWSSWTPSVSNLTVGNGTLSARYRVDGRTMHFALKLTVGSTTVVGTNPTFEMPSGWEQSTLDTVFPAFCYDSSAANYVDGVAYMIASGASTLITRIVFSGGTVSATSPFTWATNDLLRISGAVEVQPV